MRGSRNKRFRLLLQLKLKQKDNEAKVLDLINEIDKDNIQTTTLQKPSLKSSFPNKGVRRGATW